MHFNVGMVTDLTKENSKFKPVKLHSKKIEQMSHPNSRRGFDEYVRDAFNNFPYFFVQAFKIVLDS